MRVIVIGAGAWGLPTASELVRRGHDVTLIDRFGPANPWSSSTGPTRLWRVGDPHRAGIRFGRRSVAAMERLAARGGGHPVHQQLGLLWRDAERPLAAMRASIEAEQVEHSIVAAEDVARFLPGLRPDGRSALWLPEAGIVMAPTLIAVCRRLFEDGGGSLLVGHAVFGIESRGSGVQVELDDGRTLSADVAVMAAGPGARELLPLVGVHVPVQPVVEQVIHLGDSRDPHGHDHRACLFDGPVGDDAGLYAMPSPGVGYKIGLDAPLRALTVDDDRTPSAAVTRQLVARAARDLQFVPPNVIDEQVCPWTDSRDGWFMVDRIDNVVVATGDSGKGFKYAAVMGEVLAGLAEGEDADAEVLTMSLQRFEGMDLDQPWAPTAMGDA